MENSKASIAVSEVWTDPRLRNIALKMIHAPYPSVTSLCGALLKVRRKGWPCERAMYQRHSQITFSHRRRTIGMVSKSPHSSGSVNFSRALITSPAQMSVWLLRCWVLGRRRDAHVMPLRCHNLSQLVKLITRVTFQSERNSRGGTILKISKNLNVQLNVGNDVKR